MDNKLQLFSLADEVMTCKNTSICKHNHDITMLHDRIVNALIESMNLHIFKNNVSQSNANIIPGWDIEMSCSREVSLFWHHIWTQCNKPMFGIVYDIMKNCRSMYHYKLRALKKRKKSKIRIAVSNKILKNNNNNCWKSIKSIRKNNYNTTSVVDGHIAKYLSE